MVEETTIIAAITATTSTKAVSIETTPTETTLTEATLIEDTSIKTTSTEATSIETILIEATSIEATSTETTSTETPSTEVTSTDTLITFNNNLEQRINNLISKKLKLIFQNSIIQFLLDLNGEFKEQIKIIINNLGGKIRTNYSEIIKPYIIIKDKISINSIKKRIKQNQKLTILNYMYIIECAEKEQILPIQAFIIQLDNIQSNSFNINSNSSSFMQFDLISNKQKPINSFVNEFNDIFININNNLNNLNHRVDTMQSLLQIKILKILLKY